MGVTPTSLVQVINEDLVFIHFHISTGFYKETKVGKKGSLLVKREELAEPEAAVDVTLLKEPIVKKEEEDFAEPEQYSQHTEDADSEQDGDAAGKTLHQCEYCGKSFECKSKLMSRSGQKVFCL